MEEHCLGLKPLTLADREHIEKYLNINKYINSEYSFTTWYAWQGLYSHRQAVIENCLCIFGKTPSNAPTPNLGFVNFPLGEKEDVKRALLYLINYFGKKGKRLVLMSVSDLMLETLEEIGIADLFEAERERDREDYVCARENFTLLAGKKLHGKRNHYNYFADTYNAELIPITDDLVPECQAMLADVIEDRSRTPDSELNVTCVILKDRDVLGLKGSMLLVDGKPIGVILGEGRGENCIIHIAKADVAYRGASVALFKLFLEQNFTECKHINLMDDMGIEGLRRAKMGWRPEYLAEYNILTSKAVILNS